MSDKLTIQKLAAELSLSRSTVHRALTCHPNVHPETRRKVLQAAQRSGYMRHGHGKRNVAIIVPDYRFFGYLECLLAELEKEFHRRGFLIDLISLQDIELLGNFMFDGILSLVWTKGLEKTLPQKFAVPIITVNTASNTLDSVPVIMSDPHGIRMALDYLYNRGCRKIFYVATLTKTTPDAIARLEEFRNFCTETGQVFESMYMETTLSGTGKAVARILEKKADACFCASENYAVKIGLELKAAGLRIPEDISLMGMDSFLVNECFTPPITSLRQNFEKIAEIAAESMFQAIVNRIPPAGATIPFRIIERESVRKPARKSSRSGK